MTRLVAAATADELASVDTPLRTIATEIAHANGLTHNFNAARWHIIRSHSPMALCLLMWLALRKSVERGRHRGELHDAAAFEIGKVLASIGSSGALKAPLERVVLRREWIGEPFGPASLQRGLSRPPRRSVVVSSAIWPSNSSGSQT